jgi:3'-5' exoribonuclease
LKKRTKVSEIVEGMAVEGVYGIEECDLRRARNGSLYISLVLFDSSGRVNARKWDARESDIAGIESGALATITGFAESYKSQIQVVVRQMAPQSWEDADPADFMPSSKRDAGEMLAELKSLLSRIANPHLKGLIGAFFADEVFLSSFVKAPAAVKLHHAYLGGLLEHTLGTVKAALAVAALYPALDAEMLAAGAFLHDVGKIDELGFDRAIAYTDGGKLMGHITIGARMLDIKASEVPGFPQRTLDLLTHMILSHHGKYEFGSPKLPMTAEAVALNLVDDLDAKVKAVESMRETGRQGEWSDYMRVFERAFYFGGADE